AYAESKCDYSRYGESGLAQKHSNRISQILPKCLHLLLLCHREHREHGEESLNELCVLCGKKLFIPKRDHRIDLHRSPRRYPTSKHRSRGEQQRNERKGDGIRRAHSIEQTRHQSSQSDGSCKTYDYSDKRKRHTLSQNQPDDIARLRTKSDSDAYFVNALRDR